jgi:hypothetical protein
MQPLPRSSSTINPPIGFAVLEKLGKSNHALWQAQVLAAIRGAWLEGHLIGSCPAPATEISVKGCWREGHQDA